MSPSMRKLLRVVGGLAIAAGITTLPWTYMDRFTGAASSVYGISALIRAPTALMIGLASGAAFVLVPWPRQPRHPPTSAPDGDRRGDSSFEA